MSTKDQQNLGVIEQGNGNGKNGDGLQTENYFKSDHKKHYLDERFITNIKGKDFALYAGLLDLAHQMGLKKLQVQPIQYPTKDNGYEAICLAVAETQDGKVTEDIGDCNPTNCHTMVSKHLLRMASTRAKARALRDLTNIGITCFEEIGDPNEVIGNEEYPSDTKPRTRRRSTKASKESQKETKSDNLPASGSNGEKSEETPKGNNGTEFRQNNNGGPKMSQAQKKAVENLSRRRRISMEDIDRMTREMFNISFEHLSNSDASALIHQLQEPA